jgi:hypothetical protein
LNDCDHRAIYDGMCVYCGENKPAAVFHPGRKFYQHPDDRVAKWPDCESCHQPAGACLARVTHRTHEYISAAMLEGRKKVFSGIVCLRSSAGPVKRCVYCGAPAGLLCDGRRKGKKGTCDRPLCKSCAWSPMRETDFCRDCRSGSTEQLSLVGGKN